MFPSAVWLVKLIDSRPCRSAPGVLVALCEITREAQERRRKKKLKREGWCAAPCSVRRGARARGATNPVSTNVEAHAADAGDSRPVFGVRGRAARPPLCRPGGTLVAPVRFHVPPVRSETEAALRGRATCPAPRVLGGRWAYLGRTRWAPASGHSCCVFCPPRHRAEEDGPGSWDGTERSGLAHACGGILASSGPGRRRTVLLLPCCFTACVISQKLLRRHGSAEEGETRHDTLPTRKVLLATKVQESVDVQGKKALPILCFVPRMMFEAVGDTPNCFTSAARRRLRV